jgi:hypothetical protein
MKEDEYIDVVIPSDLPLAEGMRELNDAWLAFKESCEHDPLLMFAAFEDALRRRESNGG